MPPAGLEPADPWFEASYGIFTPTPNFCAPRKIRTPNFWFEAKYDIHFTIGAKVWCGGKVSPRGQFCLNYTKFIEKYQFLK